MREYIPRLKIRLDVWAVNVAEAQGKASPAETVNTERDLIFSEPLRETEDPFLVVDAGDGEEADSEPTVLAIWEAPAVLNRPSMKFSRPGLFFEASANLLPPKSLPYETPIDDYLPAYAPPPVNLFEKLRDLPAFRDNPPYLPASRLERVIPDPSMNGSSLRVRHVLSKAIPVLQAVSARIRYTRSNVPGDKPLTIALLDVEITPYVDLEVSLDRAEVDLVNGNVEAVVPHKLPIVCRPKDIITILYFLRRSEASGPYGFPSALAIPIGNASAADAISVSVQAGIRLSETCRAQISLSWTTNVDLSVPVNPVFGTPSQPLQRGNRPSSLPVFGSVSAARASISNSPRSSVIPSAGLAISFTASPKPVIVGEAFRWTVLVVNRGPKTAKLAIVPLAQIQRPFNQAQHFNKRHAPQRSPSSGRLERQQMSGRQIEDLASAVLDENIIYALQHQNPSSSGTDLLSLTAEVRIGPLAPGTCHETEIKLLALRPGALQLDAVRIVDLVKENEEGVGAAGVITDIRNLPDIVAISNYRKGSSAAASESEHESPRTFPIRGHTKVF